MTQISKLPTLLPTGADAIYVVTGGNRGLGLEHVRQFLEKTQGKSHRLTVVTLDLSDESSIKEAAEQINLAHPRGIDLLLNNAGMQEPITRASETAGSEYVHVLTTNVVGPYLTTKHLLPSLMKKKTRVIVNTSSLYDSVNATLNDNGHHSPTGSVLLASNTSKAAVNMQSAVLANDLKQDGFIVISLDTGWVRTEMGNTTEELGHGCAPLDVLTSVAGQQKVIMALTQKQTGKYLNWDGKAPKEHPSSHAFVTASAAPQAGTKAGTRPARPLKRPFAARTLLTPHWSARHLVWQAFGKHDALHSLL
ncbi:hypothetical protein WJX79_002868 [Trebouxia sp. C0005]